MNFFLFHVYFSISRCYNCLTLINVDFVTLKFLLLKSSAVGVTVGNYIIRRSQS